MAKLVILLVTLFFVGICSARRTRSPAYEETPVYGGVTVETVQETDNTELYTAVASNVFEFLAKMVRSKMEIIHNIQRALIPIVVPGLIRVFHWGQRNKETVNWLVATGLEILRVFAGQEQVNVEHAHYGVPVPEYGIPPHH